MNCRPNQAVKTVPNKTKILAEAPQLDSSVKEK